MPEPATGAAPTPAVFDPNLVYVNGIDLETGKYAVAPRSIEELAKDVRQNPGTDSMRNLHGDQPQSFGLPFDVAFDKLEKTGWGIIFHEDTPQDVRIALGPLITLRGNQAKGRFKELDYKTGEQTRDWYARHGIAAGTMEPEAVPYYLLVVGGPDLIPFEFQ